MLNKKYLGKLKSGLHAYAKTRLEVIQSSDTAIHHAKRAIFALHRDDKTEAEEKIKSVEKILKGLALRREKNEKIQSEGAYRAALEEYAEAKLFFAFLTAGQIGEVRELKIEPEIYLAGLCDVPGELLRYAIKAATNRDLEMVRKCAKMAQEIIGELTEFNLTSYLRTKFDQAKQALHKLEQVVYEVSLRQ